jgi:hypothetical protein
MDFLILLGAGALAYSIVIIGTAYLVLKDFRI